MDFSLLFIKTKLASAGSTGFLTCFSWLISDASQPSRLHLENEKHVLCLIETVQRLVGRQKQCAVRLKIIFNAEIKEMESDSGLESNKYKAPIYLKPNNERSQIKFLLLGIKKSS